MCLKYFIYHPLPAGRQAFQVESENTNQIFPFVIFPQFFLAGVFTPIKNLPPVLWALSRIAPMTYAVDLVRGVFVRAERER